MTGCVRWSVGWLVGLLVKHSFDNPHVAPYRPTWPCSSVKFPNHTLLRYLCIRPCFREVLSAFIQSRHFGFFASGFISERSRLPLSNHVIFPSHFFTHNEKKKEQADRKKMLLVRTTRFQTDCRQSCKWAKIPVHVSNEVKL